MRLARSSNSTNTNTRARRRRARTKTACASSSTAIVLMPRVVPQLRVLIWRMVRNSQKNALEDVPLETRCSKRGARKAMHETRCTKSCVVPLSPPFSPNLPPSPPHPAGDQIDVLLEQVRRASDVANERGRAMRAVSDRRITNDRRRTNHPRRTPANLPQASPHPTSLTLAVRREDSSSH